MSDDPFVRVYRLPPKLTDGFCFGGGRPIAFQNVDWFQVPEEFQTREAIEQEVRRKNYFSDAAPFLVLCDLPQLTFTIGRISQ